MGGGEAPAEHSAVNSYLENGGMDDGGVLSHLDIHVGSLHCLNIPSACFAKPRDSNCTVSQNATVVVDFVIFHKLVK